MPVGTVTFDLDQPPERVFDYIADIRNESEWSKDMVSAAKVTDGPVGDGTVFETVYRGFGRMRITTSEYRRPSHLRFDGAGPRMDMRFVMDIEPVGSGSQVSFFVELLPKGAMKLLSPVLKLGMPREMAKRPGQFRAALGG